MPTQNVEAKKLIDATMPSNISAADKAALLAKWDAQAAERHATVARQYATPKECSAVFRFEVKKFGNLWQSYALSKGGKRMEALLPAPSMLSSALAVLGDTMYEQCKSGKR